MKKRDLLNSAGNKLFSRLLRFVMVSICCLTALGCATLVVPKTPIAKPNGDAGSSYRSSSNIAVFPQPPIIKDLSLQNNFLIGYRYVPKNQTEKTIGDLTCSLKPLNITPIQIKDISEDRSLTLNPVGFTMFLSIKNNSDHIINLGQSILQFEDAAGNEYRIGGEGWQENTSKYLDTISSQYEKRVDELLAEYKAKIAKIGDTISGEIQTDKAYNQKIFAAYKSYIESEYTPQFVLYEKQVAEYNASNVLPIIIDGERVYRQKPNQVSIDDLQVPQTLLSVGESDLKKANRELDAQVTNLNNQAEQTIRGTKANLLESIKNKQTEWKAVLGGVEIKETKVVKSDGMFDRIVIPPGKHRTLYIPGIDIKQWPGPEQLILKLYDVPSKTDTAGNVIKRSTITFEVQNEKVDVFR